jgi:hypothetical protein
MTKITPRVLVLDGKQVIRGDTAVLLAPESGQVSNLLSRLHAVLRDNGQVLITAEPGWDHLTDPDFSGDWTVTGGPGWYTARRGRFLLRIGKLPEIKNGNSPLLDDRPGLVPIAVRHQWWLDLTGVPFYGDGGTTALVLLDQVARVRGREPLRKWLDERAPRVREDAWPGGAGWDAPGAGAGAGPGAVTLDRNAQYLAGVPGVYVPLDAPERSGPIEFDPRRAGLWEVTVPDNPEPRLPHPFGVNARPGTRAWAAGPTVELAGQLGLPVTVHDSWTLPRERCRRLLDPWYEVLRDARAELLGPAQLDTDAAAVLRAVKDTDSRGISHLDRAPERRWYRPDWRAIFYASARTRMWRALHTAGITHDAWPARVSTDAVTYADLSAGAALPIGKGVGQWKTRN